MKKLLSALLAVMMLLTLTSCGDKDNVTSDDDTTINAEEIVEKALEEAEEHESFSIGAVEYYLRKTSGIKLEDLEPEWEWQLKNDYCAYADEPGSGYGHAVIKFTKTDGEVTSDEYDKWYQQVFDVTAKVSQDGYNIRGYEFAGEGEDALGEVTLDEAIGGWFMKGWAFRHNDKIYVVYVSDDYDKEKDSEIGNLLYYDSAEIDIGVGLQKSFDETMDEAESYMAENEDEIKEALNDYLN